MTRVLIVVVLSIHGLIHGLGFAKAFGLAELGQLTSPISRAWGSVWLACALAFVAAAAARLANASWWWMPAAPALLASQVTIIAFWGDARVGTVANVILLVPVIAAFGSWRFEQRAAVDVARLVARVPATAGQSIAPADVVALPPVVASWLERAGVVGRPRDRAVHLRQRGELQTSAGGRWMPFSAEQWVLVQDPAFVWVAHVDGPLGTSMAGRDRYVDGEGSMRIELLSLVPVVDASGPTIDQGALVRFVAEMMWYPSAALEPYVRWEPIDATSARAIVRRGALEIDGVFHFDANNDVVGFEARRYRDDELEDWIVTNDPAAIRAVDGVRIPTRSTITWRNAAGERWTWLRLELTSLERTAGSES